MDLSGVLTDATSDFLAIAAMLVSILAVYWGIKAAIERLFWADPASVDYTSEEIDDPDYHNWLKNQN